MRILGLSALDTDATACLWNEGQWSAMGEERLSRVKQHAGFPRRAIQELLRRAKVELGAIDAVVYPFMPWWVEGRRMAAGYLRDLPFALTNGDPLGQKFRHLKEYAKWCVRAVHYHRNYHRELVNGLREIGLISKLHRIDHHHAHAAAAHLTSGFESSLAVTLDWYGGGLSGSVNRCTPQGIERLRSFRYPHSTGLFYAQVTKALGFKPSRHEGKIVGLAAYGDPKLLGEQVLARWVRGNGDLRYRSGMDASFVQQLAKQHTREDVAAAYQHALEVIVTELIEWWVAKTGIGNVTLAGGVAANVKMNQRIAAGKGVRQVFIHPDMGDGGTGTGAVLAYLMERQPVRSEEWRTCFLGPAYSEAEMEASLRKAGLEPLRAEKGLRSVAEKLHAGKVVARFGGAMEYGPRALGNRSILYPAQDPTVNDWLNKRLARSEFMPFAPVTLAEHAAARYVGYERFRTAARFMTITCDCTELMRKESPAAVHVDGTARPQVVTREENPDYYEILRHYHELSGVPTLVNTSFNMHEEPIVCSPDDAVRAFLLGNLDYLSMGPFLVPFREDAGRRAEQAEKEKPMPRPVDAIA
ncbi:MAG: carbamoyltransferase [Planctomycetes bacterium]|nr:carbamoyltransferase [Planctomycetota bacterium]